VDWSQNDDHKTTVSVYSLRARERPTVSTPITWEEAERALKKKDPSLLVFETHQTLERVESLGDLFAPLLKLKQKLPKLQGIGAGRAEAISSGLNLEAHEDQPRKTPKRTAQRTPTPRRRQKV